MLALFLLMAGKGLIFTACNNSDEINGNEGGRQVLVPEDGTVLSPVNDIEGYDSISLFFNSELPIGTNSGTFFANSDQNECFVINNPQELRNIYIGDNEIPEMDFDHYTLVIGQRIEPDLYYPVQSQELQFLDNKCQMKIHIPNIEGLYSVNHHFYYWALYPKFKTEDISVSVIKGDDVLQFVENVEGVMQYDKTHDRWWVKYWAPRMYGSRYYCLMNLPDGFKVEDQIAVSLSGYIFEIGIESLQSLKTNVYASDEHYYVYLSKINKTN